MMALMRDRRHTFSALSRHWCAARLFHDCHWLRRWYRHQFRWCLHALRLRYFISAACAKIRAAIPLPRYTLCHDYAITPLWLRSRNEAAWGRLMRAMLAAFELLLMMPACVRVILISSLLFTESRDYIFSLFRHIFIERRCDADDITFIIAFHFSAYADEEAYAITLSRRIAVFHISFAAFCHYYCHYALTLGRHRCR